MVLLGNDAFLNELHKLYERSKDKGSVVVTMKRSAMKPAVKKYANQPEEAHCLLVRVTDGKKRKFSTTITDGDNSKFQASFHTIMRAHMDGLKKKGKAGKKAKACKK
mmetsp:Transcript_28851/g.81267  ORF Transcript_28851/g.81267 Transcript_28851/m.81267 type:complete len:107 (-) Transcript_28851:64-384(-)